MVHLTCTVNEKGSPEAQFRWITPQSIKTSKTIEGSELTILEVKLEDNGRYHCIPYNKIGDGEEAIVRVLVVQPARITRPLPAIRQFSTGDHDITLECEAKGFPEPHIDWFKDDQIIDEKIAKHWQIVKRPPVGR